ncbi:PLP-dependent aminotransferase family protein [Sinomonas sp. G460-2]|uniref:MocR-like pyridoxine biosynthesis transcription factor PdxR n=1 Tax=Sinomonas sp. G460-2 TaxID=3393464 RepID=UPI0039F0741F
MTDHWANFGLDLHLDLQGPRVRTGLEESLRAAIQSGRLAAGSLLPPTRALAADLGIARNTVSEAYGQLVAEGWLVARQGSGTRVAAPGPVIESAREQTTASKRLPYDLRPGYPDVGSFPRPAWLAAARAAVNAAPSEAFGYGDPQGLPVLRCALAAYLSRARGVRVTPERVVVCSGFTQGLWLLGSVLHARGARRVGVESHGHRQHRDLLGQCGLAPSVLPVDGSGATPAGLSALDAVLLTPAHQFPRGVALDPERRAEFTRWAASSGALILEDDYDGEFRYDRRPVGAVQALAPEHVAYLGTASKTLAPGVRLGWMVLPQELVRPVTERLAAVAVQTSALDQLTLAELIRTGAYDKHVRRSRLAYRRRLERLLDTLKRATPELTTSGLAAGLHTVLELPEGSDESGLERVAAARGLAVEGMRRYAAPGHAGPPALVIGYATPPQHAYSSALARLAATLAGLRGSESEIRRHH